MADEDFLNEHEKKTPQQIAIEETAYRSLLPGLVHGLKCMIQELNELREKLGYGPVGVTGLEEGWSRPRKGGITEEGKARLAQMMRERWERAKAEGKHVKDLPAPPRPPTKKKKPKGPHDL